MVQGQKVHEQLCWTIARMLALDVELDTIRAYTKLSERTIQRIKARIRKTGEAGIPKVPRKDPLLRSSRHALSKEDILVSYITTTVWECTDKHPIVGSSLFRDPWNGVPTSTFESSWKISEVCLGVDQTLRLYGGHWKPQALATKRFSRVYNF